MKGKLVKTESTYHLVVNNKIIASVGDSDGKLQKLSLKNCEIIRSGYDLDELIDEEFFKLDQEVRIVYRRQLRESLANMFNKAFEIISDKKFSEEDIKKAIHFGASWREQLFNGTTKTSELFESLKKTEWDVEVETKNSLTNGYKNQPENIIGFISEYKSVPKLDENGCLILKRK